MSNFEPQCKTRADLHREWARVLDMSENQNIDIGEFWKCNGKKGIGSPLLQDDIKSYEFAIAMVEGKPVFRGDKLWCGISNHQFTVRGLCNANLAFEYVTVYDGRCCVGINSCSWNPPKQKTFSLTDMPMPNSYKIHVEHWMCQGDKLTVEMAFESGGYAHKFMNNLSLAISEIKSE